MDKIINFPTGLDVKRLTKQVLKNEPKILKKYPFGGDGNTGLGYDSLTSRYKFYNVLDWVNTKSLRMMIRKGYEKYNNTSVDEDMSNASKVIGNRHYVKESEDYQRSNTPLYVQCWANVMRKGEMMRPHFHLSKLSKGDDISTEHFLCGNLNLQCDRMKATYYGSNDTFLLNKPGEMALFPSHVKHWTQEHDSDDERVTIAFDIFSEDYYKDSKKAELPQSNFKRI